MNAITKTGAGFALQPQNIQEAMQMADMLAKSQMVPKCYQNKPQDTLVAMMMGSELGLNPIQALQNIAVINGKPSIYGDAMLALVQNHPAFGGIKETYDESAMVATCTVWRKEGEKHTVTFSKADAEKAGLWGKAGPWSQYPKRMQTFRARGFALRDQFADALAGLISREEAEDMPERDMGTAQRAEPKQAEPAREDKPGISNDDLESRVIPRMEKALASNKQSLEDLLGWARSAYSLTSEQVQRIESLAVIEAEGESA